MKHLAWLLVLLVLLTACGPRAEYDIRGTWDYALTSTNGNLYDIGVITFSGKPTQGTYQLINIYDIEYNGEYTVSGTTLQLHGDDTWTGDFSDADTLSGVWGYPNDDNGTWVATRKP